MFLHFDKHVSGKVRILRFAILLRLTSQIKIPDKIQEQIRHRRLPNRNPSRQNQNDQRNRHRPQNHFQQHLLRLRHGPNNITSSKLNF